MFGVQSQTKLLIFRSNVYNTGQMLMIRRRKNTSTSSRQGNSMLIIIQFKSCLITSNSADIGRTGTYIALDALCREGDRKGGINVPIDVRTPKERRSEHDTRKFQFLMVNLPHTKMYFINSTRNKFAHGSVCMNFIDFEASVS